MAIFMATTKSISRGSGQSAVASASYRAGEKLQDERYGKTHNYSNRYGVMSKDIILPTSLQGQVEIDRASLWNLAERAEKRKDARVGREWIVNLPYELDADVRKQLAHAFAQTLADRYGVIADCCLHRPTQKEIERGADPRNFHAHIMFTTRQAVLSESGQLLLGDKATMELSDTKRRSLGLDRVSAEITKIRELWERLANEKLAEYGHELIDSRSYQSQGIDIVPQLKMGKDATHKERNGEPTLVGDINRLIKERNELVFAQELAEIKKTNTLADQIIFESCKSKQNLDIVIKPSNNAIQPPQNNLATLVPPTPKKSHHEVNRADNDGIISPQATPLPSIVVSKTKLMRRYELWKQQKHATTSVTNTTTGQTTKQGKPSTGQTTASPPLSAGQPSSPKMSFEQRRQLWKAEQARKQQEAERVAEQQRIAEQKRLADLVEKQRQAQLAKKQEQARQQALAQQQAEQANIAEAKRLAALERHALEQKVQEQEKQRQEQQALRAKLEQEEAERNRRRFSP